MALWPQFCGGFYRALSPVIAADQAVNVYTETREVPGGAKQITMYGTPGLRPYLSVGTAVCRGLFFQDGLALGVIGGTLYAFDLDLGTATSLGSISNDGLAVSFASNGAGGEQIGIVGGGQLKVLDTGTMVLSAAIALPFPDPVTIAFLDGYALINQANTPIVWYSALEDMTSWDPLDFFARSNTSDHIVTIGVSRDRVWAFGSRTTTLFYDAGDLDNPFLPYPGTTVQVGISDPALLGLYEDVFYFVAESAKGQRRVVSASEPMPQTISTPPIELWLSRCPTLTNARMLVYEQDGHPFMCITVPSSPDDVKTYCFDVRETLWHARAGWNSTTGRYTQWRAQGSMSVNGTTYVGDYATGDLYTLDLETYDDDGAILRRERTAPYLGAENQWLFIDQIELGMQAGVGLSSGQGSAPTVSLEISRDGARTWVNAGTATLGAQGEAEARAIWRRLGRARADRLAVRVTQTDPVKCVWGPGLWMRATEGSGQL